jgi:hypothetical protein
MTAFATAPISKVVAASQREIMMVGTSTNAPRIAERDTMTLKDALGDARRGLNAGLKDWSSPKRQMLPVDPALAASCLRLALHTGNSDLAQAAGATLNLFAEHLLWTELLSFAANEAAIFDPTWTLFAMVAKRDRAWLRRKGGTGRVTSYLIEQLVHAPRSSDAIHLWRLSFDDPQKVPAPFRTMASRARDVRRGMLSLLGAEVPGRDAGSILDDLCHDPKQRLLKDICVAAFRQVVACPALMVPILSCHAGPAEADILGELSGTYTRTLNSCRSGLPWLALALTRTTPAGRNSIRKILAAVPELGSELKRLGCNEEDVIETIGELLERGDEDECLANSSRINLLKAASRWSGVGNVNAPTAQNLDEIMRAHGPAIAEIRRSHISSSLMAFAAPGASRVVPEVN